MFRSTKIFSLMLLFVVSTTGLPITINLCKMAASEKEECVMHHKPVSSSCCAYKTSEHKPSVSFDKFDCCESEFIYKKVEDQYVVHKSSVDFVSSHQNILYSIEIITSLAGFSNEKPFYNDSSPPFLINPDLHITNSIFLI